MKFLLKIKNRLISLIKVIFYIVCFGKKLEIKNIMKSYILENSKIWIGKSGKIEFKSAPLCRENVKFNVETGLLIIGKDTFINKDSSINVREKIVIGENCLIGENVKIYDHDHIFNLENNILEAEGFNTREIKIGNNVWIGSGSIILKGVTIEDNVVIGAGSVITKSIKTKTVYINKMGAIIR